MKLSMQFWEVEMAWRGDWYERNSNRQISFEEIL